MPACVNQERDDTVFAMEFSDVTLNRFDERLSRLAYSGHTSMLLAPSFQREHCCRALRHYLFACSHFPLRCCHTQIESPGMNLAWLTWCKNFHCAFIVATPTLCVSLFRKINRGNRKNSLFIGIGSKASCDKNWFPWNVESTQKISWQVVSQSTRKFRLCDSSSQ